MNRFRAGYPGQLDDLAILRSELRIRYVSKRRNRSLHRSSNSLQQTSSFARVSELAAGERFERPYPDSKSRVLPLDDTASRLQRDCFHAPYAQHRRIIDVMTKSPAIYARTMHQVAMISAPLAIELRCKLDFKAFEFNRLSAHNFGSSEENRTPISALKGPHSGR
jgi:hypothetical protein